METTEKKLIILADWLKEHRTDFDPHTEGVTERAIRVGIDDALFKVGDMLQEILGASEELTNEFFKDCEKPCKTDIIK